MHLTYEICVDSTDGAIAAEQAGASRVELSAGLFEGGITPSLGLIETTLAAVSSLRVHVLVRPRGGDFIYDEHEIRAMERDVAAVRAAGAHGVVIGALTPDGDVDRRTMDRLQARAGSMQITFHRAFDMVADPRAVLETLIDRGYQRVLTSGQESSALEGAPLIAELVRQAGDRIDRDGRRRHHRAQCPPRGRGNRRSRDALRGPRADAEPGCLPQPACLHG